MKIFDTHCHLNDDQLYPQISEVIKRGKNAGIAGFLVVGWDSKSSLLAVKIAEEYDCCYAAVGYHPENLEGATEDDINTTIDLCKHPKVVAVGEIGLDYHWTKDPKLREIQKKYFEKQIKLANLYKKPVIIHSREAFEDTMEVLKRTKPEFSGTLHCYSGSVESLNEVLSLGLYIGLDGPVTFKNAKTPKEVAYEIPLDSLLLETDSPYLAPTPKRGEINEPANIRLILDEIAEIKGLSKKHIADITYENALRLFGIKE